MSEKPTSQKGSGSHVLASPPAAPAKGREIPGTTQIRPGVYVVTTVASVFLSNPAVTINPATSPATTPSASPSAP